MKEVNITNIGTGEVGGREGGGAAMGGHLGADRESGGGAQRGRAVDGQHEADSKGSSGGR